MGGIFTNSNEAHALAALRDMPQRNLAVELLRKLLSGQIQSRKRKNVVQGRSFSEMLEQSIRRYQNRAIEAAQVIEESIKLAKDIREAGARGEALGLTEEEVAFYDALEANDSAFKVLGDETLRQIARELVAAVRANVTVDWAVRENVRAQMRVLVRRILRKYGYPPDKAGEGDADGIGAGGGLAGGVRQSVVDRGTNDCVTHAQNGPRHEWLPGSRKVHYGAQGGISRAGSESITPPEVPVASFDVELDAARHNAHVESIRNDKQIPTYELRIGPVFDTASDLTGWGYESRRRTGLCADRASPERLALGTDRGSFRLPGGIAGALLGLVIWRPLFVPDVPLARIADIGAIGTPFGLAVARFGCLGAGCCFGTVSTLPWAMHFGWGTQAASVHEAMHLTERGDPSLSVHPLQIYFMLLHLAVGVFLIWFRPRRSYDGQVLLVGMVLTQGGKALLEGVRQPIPGAPNPHLQLASIALAVGAAIALVAMRSRAAAAPSEA